MRSLRAIVQFRDLQKLGLFLRMMIDILVLWTLLHWIPMPRLLGWLNQPHQGRRPFGRRDLELGELGWLYANFFLVDCLKVRNPCLLRSLTLFRFFGKRGLDSKIHFGVKKEADPIEGHSWLSSKGSHFLERVDPELATIPIYSYP
jgi:hypothetical protein